MPTAEVRDAINRARNLFEQRPSAARKTNAPATAKWAGGLSCNIEGPEGHHAISDMPGPLGGAESGPNPGWFLRAAMASCTATAIAMRAASLDIELEFLEVNVVSESDAQGLVGIGDVPTQLHDLRMSIQLKASNANADQLRELATWGEGISPVGCTMRAKPELTIEISVL